MVRASSLFRVVSCFSALERQADDRLRRTDKGRHPTRAALLDGIPWPRHSRRAPAHGTHGRIALVLTLVAMFDESDGSLESEQDKDSIERWRDD